MSNGHQRLQAIGKALKAEESRFIGYAEIERKSKALGFGMSVRTLRFYVDEGILPPPKKVGKTPVYEEDWILNVLLAIHLMKTRLNRSLTEIRAILAQLQESPEALTDKLSVLYEEYAKGGQLKPVERAGLIDAFFDLLTGRLGVARQPSEVRLAELVDCIAEHGRWEGEEWVAPDPEWILASQGIEPRSDSGEVEAVPGEEGQREAAPSASPPESEHQPLPPLAPAPEGAITAAVARSLEATFLRRFQGNFERLGRVHCPLDGKGYKAGPRERTFHKRDRSGEVLERMKRLRLYDRALLDAIPLGGGCEYRVYQRGLFGRGDLKVVVTALALSPIDAFLEQRWTTEPLGRLDLRRALEELGEPDEGVFQYVGLFSTVGWSRAAREEVPSRRNQLVCLVESGEGTAWRRTFCLDPRWGGVERVFDPESDQEKVERARDYMEEHLKPKGEFLIIRNLSEDLDVPPAVVETAIEELLAGDPELSIVESSGRQIIKRSRL